MKKPRKPSLDSIREKKFSKQLHGLSHRPNSLIVKRIDSNTFSLDSNALYRYKPDVLAGEEYKRCLTLFESRLPEQSSLDTNKAIVVLQEQMKMTGNMMFVKEMKYLPELKQIAVDTIRDLFNIPQHVNILPKIKSNMSLNPEEQDDSPESFLSLSDERKKEMWNEIQKRIILNGFSHGSAMHIWKSAHYIIKDKIDELDPQLMFLYDQYTTSISWLLWQMDQDIAQENFGDGNAITQGFNKIEFEEEGEPEANIHCNAINFPVLLHEITKGAIDYLICHGIPKEYNEEELKYYYAKSDAYENELWHYFMSPTIWIKLFQAADVDTQHLPLVIMKLSHLSYNELTDVLKACIDNKELGKLKLKEMKIVQ